MIKETERLIFLLRRDRGNISVQLAESVHRLTHLLCEHPHNAEDIAQARADLAGYREQWAAVEGAFVEACTAAGIEVVPLC